MKIKIFTIKNIFLTNPYGYVSGGRPNDHLLEFIKFQELNHCLGLCGFFEDFLKCTCQGTIDLMCA